jgi:hypothetical protein
MIYPKLLKPKKNEIIFINNEDQPIPKSNIELQNWEGRALVDNFGGKPVIDWNGQPVFAELAILQIFLDEGWDARWVEPYGRPNMSPIFLSDWKSVRYKEQDNSPFTNETLNALLKAMAIQNGNKYGGCWDIVAIKGDKLIFAELKRRSSDKIRDTQISWLKIGLEFGLTAQNFLLVEWKIINY